MLRTLLTVLGNETGVFLWGVAAAFGLTALLAASQVAYDAVRFLGAGVLIWFGVQALRSARRGATVEGTALGTDTGWGSYRAGLGMNPANPKAAVFAMSFLPQFVPAGAPKVRRRLEQISGTVLVALGIRLALEG